MFNQSSKVKGKRMNKEMKTFDAKNEHIHLQGDEI
jgi:hypothetical protein